MISTPHQRGMAAFEAGLPLTACPHKASTAVAQLWVRGWVYARWLNGPAGPGFLRKSNGDVHDEIGSHVFGSFEDAFQYVQKMYAHISDTVVYEDFSKYVWDTGNTKAPKDSSIIVVRSSKFPFGGSLARFCFKPTAVFGFGLGAEERSALSDLAAHQKGENNGS